MLSAILKENALQRMQQAYNRYQALARLAKCYNSMGCGYHADTRFDELLQKR
jgi:hypothetical protein